MADRIHQFAQGGILRARSLWEKYGAWVSGAGFFGAMSFAFTMIQVDEYALAILSWLLACFCLGGAFWRWGWKLRGVVVSVLLFALFVVWTDLKRGSKAWSAFQSVHPKSPYIVDAETASGDT